MAQNQHYVWRHYLEGWNQGNGQVYCLRDDKLFLTNPKNIMVERDFYKLQPLTQEDTIVFKYWLVKSCEPIMRRPNRTIFNDFKKIANANEVLHILNKISDKDRLRARNLALEAEERLHVAMEGSTIPLLEELRQERLQFLQDDTSSSSFFRFIAHQHFRTKGERDSVKEILSTLSPEHDFSRLHHVFCHCFADNFGGSLYVDRKRLEFVFLKDRSNGLITGDQPVVNLAWRESMEHDDVALYYPLGPNLAVLISFWNLPYSSLEISNEAARKLNESVAFSADQFLVGESEEALRLFSVKPLKQPDVKSLLA